MKDNLLFIHHSSFDLEEKDLKEGGVESVGSDDEREEDSSSSLMPQPSSLPLVSVIMGSTSDWKTMQHASETLAQFEVAHECRVVSAHRTPAWMSEFAGGAESRGIEVIIAGAGGAAHLPGMVAAQTLLPVLGVPVKSRALKGLDSLLSIVQMPAGVPVGALAIGEAGATNAALLAVAILARTRPELRERLRQFRDEQTRKVLEATLDEKNEKGEREKGKGERLKVKSTER
ncbi:MAG TPA: 5-(carboxyamino)imidazole ribonucleotide mutase [Pyrinomonadaceae bacterium]|jgi:5-(carboxyamino)imidazole ribonucleotide mutase